MKFRTRRVQVFSADETRCLYGVSPERASQMVKQGAASPMNRSMIRLAVSPSPYGNQNRPSTTTSRAYSYQVIIPKTSGEGAGRLWQFKPLRTTDQWAFNLSLTDCMK